MNKRRRTGPVLIIIGAIVVLMGIGLGWYNLWDDQRAGMEAGGVIDVIAQHREEVAGSNPQGSVAANPVVILPAPEENLPDYVLHPEKDMPSLEIDGYRYIGTVTIPLLDLELPIMEDWSYPLLKIAPCRYKGSAYLNNMIICAHNYATHFGRLKNLEPGDEVIFTDMDGNMFRYKVVLMETLEKYAVEQMESGEWDLTLFTCTLGGKTRVTVRCELITD